MKVLRGLVLSILLLIVLAVSANRFIGGLWNLGPDPILTRLLGWMPAWMSPLGAGALAPRLWAAGILLLLTVYWVLCLAVWTRRPKPLRVRTVSGGSMLIHPGAILKFIKIQIDGHPAVISSRVRVRQTGASNLAVNAAISVQPIESLPVIDEQIKQAVRDGLSQVMGIEKIDDITLLLDIDEKNLALKPGPESEPEPEPVPPARAPLAEEPQVRIEPTQSADVQLEENHAEVDRLREQEQIFMPAIEEAEKSEEKTEEKY